MSDDFHAAAAYLSSTSSQTDTSTKLEVYSLFKVVTVSLDGPNTSRPSVFDLTGKAKWDAWKKASEQYQTVEQAESRYVEIAKGLGWTAGAIHVREQDAADSTGSQRGHGGMGFFVSTMAFSEEKDDKTVHGAAVDGNVAALQALIATADVNARDEYGYTALHLAADRGHPAVVELLLQHGADPTLLDPDEMTAEELARTVGNEAIVAALRKTVAAQV